MTTMAQIKYCWIIVNVWIAWLIELFPLQVRREKPPYLRSQPVNRASSSAGIHTNITEQELDPLMELDIIKATLAMGFPSDKVRSALRRKLEQTGLPFLRLETCIEAVLLYMEEETRLALQNSSRNVEAEAAAQQGAKMEALQSTSDTQATTTAAATVSTSSSSSSSSLSSSAGPSSQSDPGAVNSEEPMETESLPTSPTDDVLSQADHVIGLAEEALNAAPTSSSSPTPNPSTGASLVTSGTSTPTTPPSATPQAPVPSTTATLGSTSSHSPSTVKKTMNNQPSDKDKPATSGNPQTCKFLIGMIFCRLYYLLSMHFKASEVFAFHVIVIHYYFLVISIFLPYNVVLIYIIYSLMQWTIESLTPHVFAQQPRNLLQSLRRSKTPTCVRCAWMLRLTWFSCPVHTWWPAHRVPSPSPNAPSAATT